MKIKVIEPGCPFCKTLFKWVDEVIKKNQHITDFKSFMKYFPMTPILIINGEVRHKGKWLPRKKKIKQWLIEDDKNIEGGVP